MNDVRAIPPPAEDAQTETELKFLLGPEDAALLAAHPAFAAPARTDHLRSVYFDTADLELKKHGMALRVRHTGDRFVQTLKQEDRGSGFCRGEWEVQTDGEEPSLGALEKTPAARVLADADRPLEPVFTTAFDRTARIWNDGQNAIEVSLDDGEILAGEDRAPIRELELELKQGQPGALFGLARELAKLAPMRLSLEDKAERGHKLAQGVALEPRRARPIELRPDMTAAEAFVAIAHDGLGQVSANAELLLLARRPEALHQLRVGLRRLRAALSLFKPMLAGPGLERARSESAWIAHELDPARDLDVLISGTYRPAAAAARGHDHGLAAFGEHLLKAQTQAYGQAIMALQSARFASLLLETAAWIEAGDWRESEDGVRAGLRCTPAADYAAGALARLRRQVRLRGQGLERMDPVSRHQFRIRIKRLRYAAEFFASLFTASPGRQRKFMAALRELQDGLGELNDINAARELARRETARRNGELAFAAGRAVGRREGAEQPLLKAAVRAFEGFQDAKPYWKG